MTIDTMNELMNDDRYITRSPQTASPKSTLKAPAAAAAVVVTEARTISGPLSGLPNSEAVDVGGGQAVSRGPGAGVGMHSAGSGGSGASGLEKVGSENGVGVGGGAGAVSDESSAAMSGTIKEVCVCCVFGLIDVERVAVRILNRGTLLPPPYLM